MDSRLFNIFILTSLLAGCGPVSEEVTIPFRAEFLGTEIDCESREGVALSDLRIYVNDLKLVTTDGRQVPVELLNDRTWQNRRVGMIDLESNRGSCENGTDAVNAELSGTVPLGDYAGLNFVLGVPFDLNHADPLQAQPPLDDTAMHWHWRSGYKFLRAGVRTPTDNFWMHLGSTACEGTVGAIRECKAGNRVPVEIAQFQPGKDAVVIDLSALLSTALEDGVPSDCSSGPAESACKEPFAALGIEFPGGRRVESQRVFRKGDRL